MASSALRFYEERGLIRSERAGSGHRRFAQPVIRCVAFIVFAQRVGLTECIGCGCLSLDRCKLANPDDRAAARGPGPRYWIGDPQPEGAWT